MATRTRARGTAVLTLNTCLLPSHLRWIFRAHRGAESLEAATTRVASAILAADRAAPVEVVHLQEVFVPASLDQIAAALRPAGFVHVTAHARCGLATLSKRPLRLLELRETAHGPFTPKGWLAVAVAGSEGDEGEDGSEAETHVNCHFASELDGSRRARLAQARAVGGWVRAAREPASSRVLVLGDLNEPDGPGFVQLARTLGASPLDPAMGAEDTYRWLGGLVRGRLDRAIFFAPGSALGVELAGTVVVGLLDVSDHYALRVQALWGRAPHGAETQLSR
ncbi:Endonuclease/exonuclease/phosphatase [Pavlovales sp. CCMP2436]|nr:Endonuclease/exonuclease/phosphatase [Pavlovales sp. CCMP2436]